MLTNEQLVTNALAGDQDAYTELYRILQTPLRHLAWRYFRHNETRREEFQADASSHILMNLSKFEGRSKFLTWAHSAAVNVALSIIRSARDHISLKDDDGKTIDVADQRDEHSAVNASLVLQRLAANMTEEEYMLLVSTCIEGKTPLELHALPVYNMWAHNSIKGRVWRARNRAKEILAHPSSYVSPTEVRT